MDGIRVGRISAVNYKSGMARVVYSDKENVVTKELPLLSFEYNMPSIDDLVLVCHLPNGTEAGVIIGPFWTGKNKPPEGKKGIYRKDLSKTPGKCYVRYDENTGVLTINSTTALTINTEEINITASRGNITINGVTLT